MVYDVGKVLWHQLPILLRIDNRIFKICSLSKTQFDINHNERQYGRLVYAVFHKSTLRNVMITKLKNFPQTNNTCAGHCSQKIEKTSDLHLPPAYPNVFLHALLHHPAHLSNTLPSLASHTPPPASHSHRSHEYFFHTHPYAHTSRPPFSLLSPTFLPHLPPALKFSLAQSLLRSSSPSLNLSCAQVLPRSSSPSLTTYAMSPTGHTGIDFNTHAPCTRSLCSFSYLSPNLLPPLSLSLRARSGFICSGKLQVGVAICSATGRSFG